jgi:coenzyme PQQ precursor peptide PqqA
LAQYSVEAQIRAITDGGMLVLSRGELSASAPIVVRIHSSTYRLIYGLWFHPLPQPHRSRYWARGLRISLIIKWRRKPGDRLLLGSTKAVRRALRLSPHRSGAIMQYNSKSEESLMVWTTPTLVEICIGLEINGYLPAEF